MEYSFISAKFLTEWMDDNDYSGIVLKVLSNKTPYMGVCGCGKTTLSVDMKSMGECPHCNGKFLYVPIKRNDILGNTISIYEKVKTVTDAEGNIHIKDSYLIIKATQSAKTVELYLDEINKPMFIYSPITDTFSKSAATFSSRTGYMYSYTDRKTQSFVEILKNLGSNSGNMALMLFDPYNLIEKLDQYAKVITSYPKIFTLENIENNRGFFVTLINVLSDDAGSRSSMSSLKGLTAKSDMNDVFDLLNINKKARPYLKDMNLTGWGDNNRIKMFNDLVQNKIPYSFYFMDLFNRDVISAGGLWGIYKTYQDILKREKINVKANGIREGSDKIVRQIVLPIEVAEVFLNFCKKFINYQIDFTKVFMERYLNLESLGVVPTLDEMVNRAYFKRINQERFSYNGKENFDTLFKQDPLEAIKQMK